MACPQATPGTFFSIPVRLYHPASFWEMLAIERLWYFPLPQLTFPLAELRPVDPWIRKTAELQIQYAQLFCFDVLGAGG
ncbi:MAG: hypothetical protein JO266_22635 [Acidobacteria bacterium]|nr:hypothetical protein [Acidobacteriota bacterium]